jgi:hypothetical protein
MLKLPLFAENMGSMNYSPRTETLRDFPIYGSMRSRIFEPYFATSATLRFRSMRPANLIDAR